MNIGDTVTCSDVELADVTHQLHKDGYQIKCEKVGARRYKFTIIGKNKRDNVKPEKEEEDG